MSTSHVPGTVSATEARVTARTPLKVKMGRDDAPRSSLEYGTDRIGSFAVRSNGWSAVTAWTVDEERNVTVGAPVNAAGKPSDVMTGREMDQDDPATARGLYRHRDGSIVRTLDMGDEPLPYIPLPAGDSTPAAPSTGGIRKPSGGPSRREINDERVKAHLARIGYTGPLTRAIREATLDALAFEAQVAEYGAA